MYLVSGQQASNRMTYQTLYVVVLVIKSILLLTYSWRPCLQPSLGLLAGLCPYQAASGRSQLTFVYFELFKMPACSSE